MATRKTANKTPARTSPGKATQAERAPAKAAAKKSAAKKGSKSMPASGKDPRGGLTAEGRKFFNETQGSHLRPGVRGEADTPEKMKRKGSFLTRHFTHPRGPMVKDGEPTRLALSAQAWGEPLPNSEAQGKKLAAKGRALLKQFHAAKDAGTPETSKVARKSPAKKASPKNRTGAPDKPKS